MGLSVIRLGIFAGTAMDSTGVVLTTDVTTKTVVEYLGISELVICSDGCFQ